MSVIYRRPWTRQPQTPVAPNWAHPLLRNADFVLLGSQPFYNPANASLTRVGTPANVVAADGIGLSYSDSVYLAFPEPVATGGTQGWTIAGIFLPSAAISATSAIAGTCEAPGNSTQDRALICSASGGFWAGYLYDGASKNAISTATITPGRADRVIVTTDGTSLVCAVNVAPEVTTAVSNVGYNGYTSAEFCLGKASSTPLAAVSTPIFLRTRGYWGAAERAAFLANPWQLFQPLPRRIWVPSAAAGPDVTLALSGQAATGSAGTLPPSSTVATSGQAATATAGTVTPSLSVALSGIVANASAGTVTPSLSVALSGQEVTASAGTLTYAADGSVTVALSGEAVTVSAGTVVPSVAVALAGQAAVADAGTLIYGVVGDITAALSGQAVTVSAGSMVFGQVADITGGGGWAWAPIPKRKSKKELREERIALGILPPDVIEELPAPVIKKARKVGTIKVEDLFGKAEVTAMSTLDLEIAIQRIKRKRRQRQEEELLLM